MVALQFFNRGRPRAFPVFSGISNLLIIFIMLVITGLLSCSKEQGLPDKVLKEAKQRTETYINEVIAERDDVSGPVEYIGEHYDGINDRYVLEYTIETRFGSAFTDSPTAYVYKKDGQWHYEFTFGEKYESNLARVN